MAFAALAITGGCGPKIVYEYPDAGPTMTLADGAVVPAGDAATNGGNSEGGPGGEPSLTGTWVDATGNLADPIKDPSSDCGALSFVNLRADGALVAGVDSGQGIWVNSEGTTWTQLGNTKNVTGRPSSIAFDPKDAKTIWMTTMYDTDGAIFKATDGKTFAPLGDAHHIEGVSVDFSDPDRKTIVAAGHERVKAAYLWNNTKSAWDEIGTTLPDSANNSQYPLVIDAKTFLMGCVGWGGTTSGIYRTTDAGKSWKLASRDGGRNTPLVTAKGAIYWAGDKEHMIAKSTDNGKTWTQVVGDKQSVSTVTPIELPDGRLVSLSGKDGAQYAIASEDEGVTWKPISVALPFTAIGVLYHADRKQLYVWHQLCGNDGSSYGIASYEFDHTKQ